MCLGRRCGILPNGEFLRITLDPFLGMTKGEFLDFILFYFFYFFLIDSPVLFVYYIVKNRKRGQSIL